METADFVIVGAGIAGASAAYELAAHGSVVVVEQEAVAGHHTTGRSAALFTEAYERGPVRALAIAGRPFFESPPDGFCDGPLFSPLSIMILGREDQRAAVDAAFADAIGWVPSCVKLDAAGIREVCPVIAPGYGAVAAFEPHAREIDVHALHQGFLRGMRARGGRLLLGSPVRQLARSGDGWAVSAGQHRLSAGTVVNAAGAWADRIGALAGARPIGLVPRRRTAFTFPAAVDTRGLPFVIDASDEFYFKPEGEQFLGSLSEQTPMEPHDVKPAEADVALAIERIERATTLRIRHVRSAWAGLRSFVPDRLPVVGMDPGLNGFFWLAGQGGFGIMTSPALGRTTAALITSGAIPADVERAGITAAEMSPDRLR